MVEFALPRALEARRPAEPRDGVRLIVGDATGVSHHAFTDLPDLLRPGDLLVVNTSGTLPAAVRLDRTAVHFSTPLPDGSWLVELRQRRGRATRPYDGGCPGEWIPLPGGATLTLIDRANGSRLWWARLASPRKSVVGYLRRYGEPIRYEYVADEPPLSAYQTVFAREPGSAEMPSAGRPFTTRLVSAGVLIAPITLHTGVASQEKDEPPYPERYDVPAATAALVNHVRREGGRVIAVGTTVVRALESAVAEDGTVRAARGWTSHVVTPEVGTEAVDGLLTGLHEPRSTHLWMLTAIAGPELLDRVYADALRRGYLWHEFGDANLLLPR